MNNTRLNNRTTYLKNIKQQNMKMRTFIFSTFIICSILCGCKNIKKEIIHSVSPNTYVSPFKKYQNEFHVFSLDSIEIHLPTKAEIYSSSKDGTKRYFYAKDDKILYEIVALPFEVDPNVAYGYLKPATQSVFGSFPTLYTFEEGGINGVYATLKDDDSPLMYGESFCFNKDGATFYILSYGATSNYYSTFEVVKRIKSHVNPWSNSIKKKIAEEMKEQFERECLNYINGCIINNPIIHDVFSCSSVEVDLDKISIVCILNGDYSQLYPRQKGILSSILTGTRCLKPYNCDYELLGYNFTIGFYKPSGEKIDLKH